jgi:hypothetical protein
MVNVYRGTGEVWLMPTKNVYKDLKMKGLNMPQSEIDTDM